MIIISKFTDEELPVLQYIDHICFSKKEQYDVATINYLTEYGSTYVAIDTDFDKIVGYITTIIHDSNNISSNIKLLLDTHKFKLVTEVFSIAVLPEYQRKNISQMLLDAANCNLPMYLYVKKSNENAQKAYEKNNWTCYGTIANYYGPDTDALFMCKNFI